MRGHRLDAKTHASAPQADVTLLLDMDGVIREATLSTAIGGESIEAWLGRPWRDTVGDLGSDRVGRMVEDARASGISAFRQVNQRFPSGLEIPMEYTTVLLGGRAGMLAIGKSLQAVAELQARLIAAQQAIERDYWRLRELETRYRLLVDSSNDAVLVVSAANVRILEANPAAIAALGIVLHRNENIAGRDLLSDVAPDDRDALKAMLLRVRDQGKSPGILLHLGQGCQPWMLRASLITSEPGPVFLLQLTSVGGPVITPAPKHPVVEELIDGTPDAFVIVDHDGTIRFANLAFLDLVQVGSRNSVIGERLGRWLFRPGADLAVLLANVRRHRVVRLFSTTIHGELGSDTDVEIAAAGKPDGSSEWVGILLRDVTRRLSTGLEGDRLHAALGSITEQIGRSSLRKLVKETVGVVERHYVKAALEVTGDNRTAAAELLGLSRQSLYAKLNRYGFDEGPHTGSDDNT
jgi:transcriptional regulator PpsR